MPNYLLSASNDSVVLRNYEGMLVHYHPTGEPVVPPSRSRPRASAACSKARPRCSSPRGIPGCSAAGRESRPRQRQRQGTATVRAYGRAAQRQRQRTIPTVMATAMAIRQRQWQESEGSRLEDRHRLRPRAGRPAAPKARTTGTRNSTSRRPSRPWPTSCAARATRSSLLGDGREFLAKVLADPPDFVWNLAEGEGVGRCREARVPAVLEMLGIPCTGSDPLTLAALPR